MVGQHIDAPSNHFVLKIATLHKIYYRTYLRRNAYALVAAMAPSETAVTTWRKRLERMSPAANRPGVRVAMDSSVRMPPSGAGIDKDAERAGLK